MSSDTLDRILGKYPTSESAEAASQENEAEQSAGCWGYSRSARDRVPMLELRRRDGVIRSVSYGFLDHCDFDPAGTITLHVSGAEIKITGRNLTQETSPGLQLFTTITRHRCQWIREATQQEDRSAGKDILVIESICW